MLLYAQIEREFGKREGGICGWNLVGKSFGDSMHVATGAGGTNSGVLAIVLVKRERAWPGYECSWTA